jgi:hypothetical protein
LDQKPKEEKPEMIKLTQILKYSSPKQKLLVFFGILFSIGAGVAAPWAAIIMGKVIAIYNPKADE